jgi:hypothetical protein
MPVGMGDESIGAAGKVVHPCLAAAADRRGIEGDEIGHRSGTQHTPVGQAVDERGMAGESPHRVFDRQITTLPHEAGQQVGGVVGVAQLTRMGARVGQADHHRLVGE